MYTRPSVDRYGSFLLPDYHECIYLSLEMDIIILMSMLQLFCKLHCFKHLHIPCQGSTFKRFLFVLGCSQILIHKHISSKLAHKRLRAGKKFGKIKKPQWLLSKKTSMAVANLFCKFTETAFFGGCCNRH